ncbi:MAG: peptidoglycan DD-metalloendopeptidase family protein [Chlorobiota bacterium]
MGQRLSGSRWRRLIRPAFAFCLAFALGYLPSPASAKPAELERYRQRLNELQRSIDQLRQQLQTEQRQELSLQQRVERLRRYRQLLQRSIVAIGVQLRLIDDSLRLLQQQLDLLRRQHDTLNEQQRQLLRRFYAVWIRTEDPLLRSRLQHYTAALFSHYAARQQDVAGRYAVMAQLQARLASLYQQRQQWLQRREEQQRELTAMLSRQEHLLRQTRERQRQLRLQLEKRRQSAQQLRRLIERLIAEARRRSSPPPLPTSPRTSSPTAQLSSPTLSGRLELRWPSVSRKLLRGYGLHRNPETGVSWENPGVDISAPYGTPVRPVAAGTVKAVQWLPTYQYVVIVEHAGNFRSVYANLSSVAVKPGTSVTHETVLGFAGNTPDSEGFHFQLWHGRRLLNPLDWLK